MAGAIINMHTDNNEKRESTKSNVHFNYISISSVVDFIAIFSFTPLSLLCSKVLIDELIHGAKMFGWAIQRYFWLRNQLPDGRAE